MTIGVVLAAPATAAAESCVYDSGTKTITATITPGSEATLKVRADGELWFGLVPASCGGATTTNTDFIQVNGNVGTNERFVLDQSEGFLGPGFTSEHNLPEIEMGTVLGDTTDRFVVYGTPGDDTIAAGVNGVALNVDGDLDITFSPGIFHFEAHGLAGNDFINARGQGGAGLAFRGPTTIYGADGDDELIGAWDADRIYGGEGNDIIYAHQLDDLLEGGPGDDFLSAGEDNDTLVGGPGADTLNGGYGDDLLLANDQEIDTQIHGAQGTDTALVDVIDPATIAVENKTVDPGPPPPPPPPGGSCTFNAATGSVAASLPAGATGTLAVVGGAIHFGVAPTACEGATVTNTDTITVTAPAGSVERLTVDQSGGALAPGATAEATGISEIEVELNLGDATDLVTVRGADGSGALAVGTKGVSVNGDADVDVTFGVLPATIELIGGAGGGSLSARGGFGAGQVFAGPVTLRAGSGGDTLTGSDFDDLLVGGAGADTITGYGGNDTLEGNGGADKLNGNDGNDTMIGGAGADTFVGGAGDDVLVATDGEADVSIHGAQGSDTAYYDAGIDPTPVAVEILNPQ